MLSLGNIIAQFEQNALGFAGSSRSLGKDAGRTICPAVFAFPCARVVNFTTCDKLVPDALDCVFVHADKLSQEPVRLPGVAAKLRSDHISPLLPGQLPPQAVCFNGMMSLALVIKPADYPPRIVLDPKLFADTNPLMPVQDIALFCDLDGDLDAPYGDVILEGLELLRGQVREDLIGRSVVVDELAHR